MTISDERTAEFRARFDDYTRTLDCVHCGLCVPHCPTYEATLHEADSPRGRIYLMRQFAEGALSLSPLAGEHLDRCIVCRACETACPSGVRMGDLMESFRALQRLETPARGVRAGLGRWFLRRVLPHRRRIAAFTDLVYAAQLCRFDRVARWLDRVLCRGRFASVVGLWPPIPPLSERRLPTDADRPEGFPAHGTARMRVGLFLGCIASEWFAHVHRATVRVLQKNGCDVVLPAAQTCCGALHRHAGLRAESVPLWEQNARAFAAAGVDAIVVNAAGCGAALKEAPPESTRGSLPVRDVCELLDEIGLIPPTERVERTVAYDQPCHLVHGQRIGKAVVEGLLAEIPGLRLVDLPGSEDCCGSGGVYNLAQRELAAAIGAKKAAAIRASGAETIATGNPGCSLQIRAALGDGAIEVVHPIELLDRAYGDR